MHILFLSDNFPPEVNAPASRTFEHCREWVRAGHKVTVITCAPNFPKGKVFGGYRNRLWQKEIIDGIAVIRVWSYMTANAGFSKRVLDYVSYMTMAILAAPFVGKPDIVVATSPQFFTACAGYVVGLFKRVPFVFELRDIWPASIRAVGAMKQSRTLDRLERLELFLYKKAALIISVTHAFGVDLVARGVAGAKIKVVTNGVSTDTLKPQPKDTGLVKKHALKGKFVLGYIGTHGMAHALETILEAARQIQECDEDDVFRFLFLGDGANKPGLVAKVQEMGLNNVVFVDTVPKSEIAAYWSVLDVSIIHLKKTELFTSVIPSKIFECMAMGIPMLHGVEGESADIIEKEAVGVLFEPENPAALRDGIVRLHEDAGLLTTLSKNGPKAAANYDRKKLALEMLHHLETTARRSGKPPL